MWKALATESPSSPDRVTNATSSRLYVTPSRPQAASMRTHYGVWELYAYGHAVDTEGAREHRAELEDVEDRFN